MTSLSTTALFPDSDTSLKTFVLVTLISCCSNHIHDVKVGVNCKEECKEECACAVIQGEMISHRD